MNIKDGDYIVGLWFVTIPPHSKHPRGGDWMASLVRKKGETEFRFEYRFRWYVDERIFDHEDETNWYCYSVPDTEDEAVWNIQLAAGNLAKSAKGTVEFMPVRGGFKEFYAEASSGKYKWLHLQMLDMNNPNDRAKAEGMGLPVPPVVS